MCLCFFSYKQHPEFELILIQNRDEFYLRPTEQAKFWGTLPDVLGGKDLKNGGMWLGMNRLGRIALVSNYRDPSLKKENANSRGILVRDYLFSCVSTKLYLERVLDELEKYNEFNLIAGDTENLFYLSSRLKKVQRIAPGFYGLSNHLLNTPWPKLSKGKSRLEKIISKEVFEHEQLFEIMHDNKKFPDDSLPSTGIDSKFEKELSSIFINTHKYGTRATTLVMIKRTGEVIFIEKSFGSSGEKIGEKQFQFICGAQKKASDQKGSH